MLTLCRERLRYFDQIILRYYFLQNRILIFLSMQDKKTKINEQQLRLASLHVEQPKSNASSLGKANMKFQIPQAASPGDKVTVISPSGEAVTVQLPPACQAGQWITVQYDLPKQLDAPSAYSGSVPPPPPPNSPPGGSSQVMTFQVPIGSVPGGPCAVITPTGKTVVLTLPASMIILSLILLFPQISSYFSFNPDCSVGQWVTIQHTG
jgi:hypothetical protein